jgi:hypothetical protein
VNIDQTSFARREYARRVVLRQTSAIAKEMEAAGIERRQLLNRVASIFASFNDLVLKLHADLTKQELPLDEHENLYSTQHHALDILPVLRKDKATWNAMEAVIETCAEMTESNYKPTKADIDDAVAKGVLLPWQADLLMENATS